MNLLSSPPDGGLAGGPGPTGVGAPRVTPAILLNRVSRLRRGAQNGDGDQPRVLLVRAQPEWPAPRELDVAGRHVRVVPCVSALAVLEQVTCWARDPVEDGWLVLLTDADEDDLGDSVLAQVHRQRVDILEPWIAVLEDFGANQADPRLRAPEHRWVAQALLEARPPAGWPRRPGGQLTREDALAELAAVRLGLTGLGLGAADLDIATLLRWSASPGAVDALRRLGDEERAGLTGYLAERTGRAGRALVTLLAAGNGDRALALGLVCDCLWPARERDAAGPPAPAGTGPAARGAAVGGAAGDIAALERARARVERFFGDVRLDDAIMRAFADAVREVVTTALASARPGAGRLGLVPPDSASSTLHPQDEIPALLDVAERLLDTIDARAAGAASDILRAGFDHRLAGVATTIRDVLTAAEAGVDRALLARAAHDVVTAVGSLRAHLLSAVERPEVERAVMAARLVGWLVRQPTGSLAATPPSTRQRTDRERAGVPTTLPDALDAHLDDGAWADIALGHLAAGAPAPAIGTVYGDLYRVAARRRRTLDEAFARLLAVWTTTAGLTAARPKRPLTVEDILDRVVAPVVTSHGGRALLVVLDGMNAALAAQLAAELRRERWEECDPLGPHLEEPHPGEAPAPARRRAAVAVLPTVTAASRTSLLAGRLITGDKAKETLEFEGHPRWGRRAARLFHHADLAGAPGAALDGELTEALTSNTPLVAVVINTIDDMLDRGRQRDDGGWGLTDVGRLQAVLGYARTAGRAVILTSDHGHVLDHGAEALSAVDAVSARHRVADKVDEQPRGDGEPRDGEVELAGPRVLAPGGRIIALWDPARHYLGRHGGYHGGASPAEVTVPVLAFLPFHPTPASGSRGLPPGWRPLPDQRPDWWSLETADPLRRLGGDTLLIGPRSASGSASASGRRPASDEGTMLVPTRRRRRSAEEQTGPALFELPQSAPSVAGDEPSGARPAGGKPPNGEPSSGEPSSGEPSVAERALTRSPSAPVSASPAAPRQDSLDALVAALLAAELFQSQLDGLARKVPVAKVEAAVRALLDANGTLATSVVAERAGERPARAGGFAVTLQRLFNIDNYPVLEPIDDGHTLRLNIDLLRAQFGLPG
ncbi:PglZ domain protein [Frankia canadensis]|uniref:PglZ domain protein n=1 Tax=Frankia canadensis TaxID=1836972 RepID=A0A2I2KNI8_9ACTN|nr:BREX-2 system phosphatase PglZ [Frankia canadensis]SNQ47233.1 PglZ domain protein [Frankia canadensis]SOU54523.1 PglZ domain protein [Frankia canadensis]